MSEDAVTARIVTQATDAQRRAVADVVIVNDGTREHLATVVDEVWRTRIAPLVDTA